MLPTRTTPPSSATSASPEEHAPAHRRRLPRTRTAVVVAGACAATAIAGTSAAADGAAGATPPKAATVHATVRPAAAPSVSAGRMLVELPWGAGPGAVGLAEPGQGLARGPEALAVAADGRIAILDGVNRRLLLLDGHGVPNGSIPVPLASPRFLTVDDDRLFVTDAESDRRIIAWNWQGRQLGSQPLPSLDQPATGVLLRGQQVLVETNHDQTHPLDLAAADTPAAGPAPSAAAVSSAVDAGRPLDREGAHTAEAERTSSGAVHVRLHDRADPGVLNDLELALPEPVEHIVSLDGDEAGDVVVGVRLLRRVAAAAPPAPLALTRIPAGDRAGAQTVLLADRSMVYVGQPYTVGADGRVYQPIATPTGYRIVVHEFPSEVTR